MHELLILTSFAGFVALLLWGVHMVQTGVQRAFGQTLNSWLKKAMGTPYRAFLAGLLVTAAIQSSTATGLLVSSFAMDGLVSLVPGLAAMLGANVGTTLIVQALSFDLTRIAPVLVLIGVWLFRRHPPSRPRDIGRVFIGLGLLLLSLEELLTLFEPLKTAPMLTSAMGYLAHTPLLTLLASAIITWACHSSVAVVVLIMSLAHNGLVSPETAYILVLGANVGTAINPVLESGSRDNPASRRVPVGNIGTRIAGCLIALGFLPWASQIMLALGSSNAVAIANFHLLFNLLIAVLFLPALEPYARLLRHMLPPRTDAEDLSVPRYLDAAARDVPSIVLAQATREALRLSDLLGDSLALAQRGFRHADGAAITQARQINRTISSLERTITAFLATQDPETLGQDDERVLKDVLAFSTNLARAASVSCNRLLADGNSLRKKSWQLHPTQTAELEGALQRVQANLKQATALFMANDRLSARHLAFEKDYFRGLEARAAQRHLAHIRQGKLEVLEAGAFYLEILRTIAELNKYLVEAVAYPILDHHGELRPNRILDVQADPQPPSPGHVSGQT